MRIPMTGMTAVKLRHAAQLYVNIAHHKFV